MPDDMDRATALTEAHHQESLAAVTRRLRQPGTPDCEICGEPIPARRRQEMPSARRCRPCQEAMETRRAR
ncbi:TraR/DksA C4-type zinc finger protein [Sediminicoccus sp. KRV36]|uniref:TraR/DksA C4-type zinc finger protein n=1 Tax=Sediminicoccus sp. KRV36 TaxID=3133721 RepID=UPI00200BD1EB|nr:TraR/DksA C4-type zinc finger protein [Sediminicoccus rosea]UPY35524.1 TraR/DksA C4-type zinc finger protein [Sediminicoccus rosea]